MKAYFYANHALEHFWLIKGILKKKPFTGMLKVCSYYTNFTENLIEEVDTFLERVLL